MSHHRPPQKATKVVPQKLSGEVAAEEIRKFREERRRRRAKAAQAKGSTQEPKSLGLNDSPAHGSEGMSDVVAPPPVGDASSESKEVFSGSRESPGEPEKLPEREPQLVMDLIAESSGGEGEECELSSTQDNGEKHEIALVEIPVIEDREKLYGDRSTSDSQAGERLENTDIGGLENLSLLLPRLNLAVERDRLSFVVAMEKAPTLKFEKELDEESEKKRLNAERRERLRRIGVSQFHASGEIFDLAIEHFSPRHRHDFRVALDRAFALSDEDYKIFLTASLPQIIRLLHCWLRKSANPRAKELIRNLHADADE